MCAFLRDFDEVFSRLQRIKKTYDAPSSEISNMILGYHQGRLVTYTLHNISNCRFLIKGNRQRAKPRTGTSKCPFAYFCCMVTTIVLVLNGSLLYKEVQGQLLSNDWFFIDGGHTILASTDFLHFVGTPFSCQVYWCCSCKKDVLQLHHSISNSERVCGLSEQDISGHFWYDIDRNIENDWQ